MGAEVDRLELQVEAQAAKANNQLDKLVGKLDAVANSLSHINTSGLTGLANGVQKFAQASSQLSSVKTADFTRLTKNIDKLSALNTQQIFSASSAITTLSKAVDGLGSVSGGSAQLASVVNSVSALGGANVQRAVANMPALANALSSFMATMSNAPAVSRNVIRMTDALASLAAQGANVGTVGNSLARSTNTVGNSMSVNVKKVNSFADALRGVYQVYHVLARGAKKLWTSIESSMSYVETLNYFDAAYGQVAEKAVAQWADMGVASAEEYYNSFSKRAKELTSKMTGFSVNDDGTLTATGQASLGINPSQLMNYQAMFAQMSSSMGVASETSLKLSQALTELGGDLASVKNMDFDKVWQDMASGLAGMSRTLDKYGVNIRNVNLQQRLMELGIDANITALNQNDKALLRAIILLDSTRYAWGDLADTINQPANQIRLLESNWANLSRTIGNIFLPVVAKVLPYVNGLVIAVQRLFTWLGSLIGLDLSSITSSVGNSDFDFGSLIDDTDGLTDSMNDAAKAADKLKKGIRAFDELNVITTSDDSGKSTSGSGAGGFSSGQLDAAFDDIFSEYQARWDAAYAQMLNKANEIADKIEQIFQPLKDIFNDFAIGDFFMAGQDTSKLVSGIFNFFADAIDKVDWRGIGNKIGEFLNGIDWVEVISSVGNFLESAVNAAIDLWKGIFDADPMAAAIVGALAIAKFTGLDKVLWNTISTALSAEGMSFVPTITIAAVTWVIGFDVGKTLGEALFPDDAEYYENFKWFGDDGFFSEVSSDWGISFDALGDMILDMSLKWDGFVSNILENPIAAALLGMLNPLVVVREGIEQAFDVVGWIKEKWNGLKEWFETNVSKPVTLMSNDLWAVITGLWGTVSGWVNDHIIKPIVDFSTGLSKRVSQIFQGLWIIIKAVWITVSGWFNTNVITPVINFFGNLKADIENKMSTAWLAIRALWGIASGWFKSTVIQPIITNFTNFKNSAVSVFTTAWNLIKAVWIGVGNWYKTYVISPISFAFTGLWTAIKVGMEASFNAVIGGIEIGINFIVEGINKIIRGFNKVVSWAAKVAEIDWGGVDEIPTVSITRIPAYAIGGFPEDGLFYANHNELVGQFSNGKTAVVNNEQIISGIEEAAYRGMTRALAENGGNANVDIHVDGDPHGMFKVWKDEWRSESERLQKNPVKLY